MNSYYWEKDAKGESTRQMIKVIEGIFYVALSFVLAVYSSPYLSVLIGKVFHYNWSSDTCSFILLFFYLWLFFKEQGWGNFNYITYEEGKLYGVNNERSSSIIGEMCKLLAFTLTISSRYVTQVEQQKTAMTGHLQSRDIETFKPRVFSIYKVKKIRLFGKDFGYTIWVKEIGASFMGKRYISRLKELKHYKDRDSLMEILDKAAMN